MNRKIIILLNLTFLALLMVSCGPSPEEQAATAVALTAAAVTDTPTVTHTPTSTNTPSPTKTPTPVPPTATPTPTATSTPESTATPTATITPTLEPTATPTFTPTPTPTNVPAQPTEAPAPSVRTETGMPNVDGLLWMVPGYELQDNGNTINVTCTLNNTSAQAKTIRLDWVLVVDGQQYPSKDIGSVIGPPPVVGGERTISAGMPDILFVRFDTPPGRRSDQQASSFMKDKEVLILWPSFNIQLKLKLN